MPGPALGAKAWEDGRRSNPVGKAGGQRGGILAVSEAVAGRGGAFERRSPRRDPRLIRITRCGGRNENDGVRPAAEGC